MLPIITSLVQTLAVNGLGLLAGAVQAKGKEFIESKIGAMQSVLVLQIPMSRTEESRLDDPRAGALHELQGASVGRVRRVNGSGFIGPASKCRPRAGCSIAFATDCRLCLT